MPPTLLIDVDGVIVTGRPGDGAAWATDLHRDLGLDPGWLQRTFFAPHRAAIVTGAQPMRPTLDRVLAPTGVGATALLDYWFAQDARLDRAVLDTMDALRAQGWAIHLATNQEPLRMAHLMATLGAHVDGALCSAQLGAAKPDPAFYACAQAALPPGIGPGRIRFVDDTPANVTAGWWPRLWQGGDLAALISG